MTPSRAILAPFLALVATLATAQISLVDPAAARAATAGSKTSSAPTPVAKAELLPASFGTWKRESLASAAIAKFDAATGVVLDAAALREYGLTESATASYRSKVGTIQVSAARFSDAGGAYGAFTLLRGSGGHRDQRIGDASFDSGDYEVFYQGNVLVQARDPWRDAVADMRELARSLPRPNGSAANLPVLPTYLPRTVDSTSVRYLVGPVSAAIARVPLTPSEVRWDDGAEIVWAYTGTLHGGCDLVLISYPTPQMAAARLRDINAAIQLRQDPTKTQVVRRSGPIVVWVSGAFSVDDAKQVAGLVYYDANVTWNEPNPYSKRENVGGLIVAALALAGIILLISLVAGLAFGGFRILMKRLYPDRFFDRTQDVEIIRLHLTE